MQHPEKKWYKANIPFFDSPDKELNTTYYDRWTGSAWRDVQNRKSEPRQPIGDMANTVTFDQITTNKIRVVFTHDLPAKSGVTEIEVRAD